MQKRDLPNATAVLYYAILCYTMLYYATLCYAMQKRDLPNAMAAAADACAAHPQIDCQRHICIG